MTQDERDAIRARYELSIRTGINYKHSLTDIPSLLDALEAETKRADEAESENKALFDTHIDHEAAIEENLSTDRDRWKARAEALGRAVKGFCPKCIHYKFREQCQYQPEPYGSQFLHCNHWQFDESRFTGNEEGDK